MTPLSFISDKRSTQKKTPANAGAEKALTNQGGGKSGKFTSLPTGAGYPGLSLRINQYGVA